MPAPYPYAIVIGASSGIGAELVRQLARDGCRVAAFARRTDRLTSLADEFPGSVKPFVHDVCDSDSVSTLFSDAAYWLGGLDLIIYAAGTMPLVGPDEYSVEKDLEMFKVNTLGAVPWLDEAARRFSAVGGGTIVVIGSVAGDRGRKGQPAYNASKGAIATFAEALRNRLWRYGVTVTTVKPGPVATEMTASLGLKGAMPVQDAAKRILELAPSGKEVYLKVTHRVIFGILRSLPSWLFRRLPV